MFEIIADTRICCRCGTTKPLSDYHIDRRKRSQRKFHCRDCQNAYRREYASRRGDHIRRVTRAHYAKNRIHRILNSARARAKERGIEFAVGADDLVVPEFCPVLGIRLATAVNGRSMPNSPSVDRIDNSLGYVRGNVMVISFRANRMKNDSTLDELRKLVAWLETVNTYTFAV